MLRVCRRTSTTIIYLNLTPNIMKERETKRVSWAKRERQLASNVSDYGKKKRGSQHRVSWNEHKRNWFSSLHQATEHRTDDSGLCECVSFSRKFIKWIRNGQIHYTFRSISWSNGWINLPLACDLCRAKCFVRKWTFNSSLRFNIRTCA